MSWIKIIDYDAAKGKLKQLYDRIKGPENYIDNIMLVHSLRPNTLEGHMNIYKLALHHSNNQLPKWFLEAIGVYVSILNKCSYCVNHHLIGMKKGLSKDIGSQIEQALLKENPGLYFKDTQLALLEYAYKLTIQPSNITQEDILHLTQLGIDDGLILEVNQVVSYFCYANRTVLGLGVDTKGEIIGLSPGQDNDEKNWEHN
jgi:uncharacterized peroxidase-related enzyme